MKQTPKTDEELASYIADEVFAELTIFEQLVLILLSCFLFLVSHIYYMGKKCWEGD